MLTSWVMTRFCCFLLLCLSLLQFIAVLFAVGGIVLFAYEDSFGSAGWLGVLLSLGSALGAALYKVLVVAGYYHWVVLPCRWVVYCLSNRPTILIRIVPPTGEQHGDILED